MANLTITVDSDVLKKARLRATQQDTSVNAVLREYLESYSGVASKRREAVEQVLQIADRARARSGGRRWTRDELHER